MDDKQEKKTGTGHKRSTPLRRAASRFCATPRRVTHAAHPDRALTTAAGAAAATAATPPPNLSARFRLRSASSASTSSAGGAARFVPRMRARPRGAPAAAGAGAAPLAAGAAGMPKRSARDLSLLGSCGRRQWRGGGISTEGEETGGGTHVRQGGGSGLCLARAGRGGDGGGRGRGPDERDVEARGAGLALGELHVVIRSWFRYGRGRGDSV